MYKNKENFDAFCWHYDEAEVLPKDTKILASNEKSKYQSAVLILINQLYGQCNIIRIQSKMDGGINWAEKETLLENNIYENLSDLEKEKKIFENYNNYKSVKNNLYEDLLDENMHSLN